MQTSFCRLPLAKLVTCKPWNHTWRHIWKDTYVQQSCFFHLCLDVWGFYITLGCKSRRKCSIMGAPSIHKHCFSEASRVKSGSSSSRQHTRCPAKSDEPELMMTRTHISSFWRFPCLKFSGLTASSLQTGHIPQPLFGIFHNHFTPAEAPEHQINKRSFHHPYVFWGLTSWLECAAKSFPVPHPRLVPQREYPSDILQQSLFEPTFPPSWSKK